MALDRASIEVLLYQINLQKIIAIVLSIGIIIFVIIFIIAFLSIKNIKYHIEKLLSPIKNINLKTQEIARGNFHAVIKEKSSGHDIAMLINSINKMGSNLKTLISKEKENARIYSEMEIARKLQASFIHKKDKQVKLKLHNKYTLDIFACFDAGNLISGDIYDITESGNKINIFIGDTVGKDISAAIFFL